MSLINNYRAVPENEKNGVHTFRTFRYFPELQIPLSLALQDSTAPNDVDNWGKVRKNKNPKLSSTRILSQYCGSSSDEFTAVQSFHRSLIGDRLKKRTEQHETSLHNSGNFIYMSSNVGDELVAAKEKLMKVAIKYDYSSRWNDEIKGFSGAIMTIDEFDSQLKRGLHLWLTRGELEALFRSVASPYQPDILDPEQFLTYFFYLGHRAREEHRHKKLQDHAQDTQRVKASLASSESKAMAVVGTDSEILADYSEADVQAAMGKLERAAFNVDISDSMQAVRVRVFECRMTAPQFRKQLEKSFDLHLTNAEIGSLVMRFGTLSPPHVIDGHYFVHSFFQMQRRAQSDDRERQKRLAETRFRKVNRRNQVDSLPKLLGR